MVSPQENLKNKKSKFWLIKKIENFFNVLKINKKFDFSN